MTQKKKNMSSWYAIKMLFFHLDSKEKRQLAMVSFLSFLNGIAEIVSIGMIIPFVTMLVSPEKLNQITAVVHLKKNFPLQNDQMLIAAVTLIFCLTACFAAFLRIMSIWFISKISQHIGEKFEGNVYQSIISLPYTHHIHAHSGELISLIEQSKLVSGSIMHITNAINAGFASICLFLTLLIITPVISTTCFIVLGGAFIITSILSRRKLSFNSQQIMTNKIHRNIIVQESLRGIRDIILDSGYQFYTSDFQKSIHRLARIATVNELLKNSPKIIIETLALVFIASLAFFIVRDNDIESFLPAFAAIALGMQKLLPLMQKIYLSWSFFKSESFSLDLVFSYLERGTTNSIILDQQRQPKALAFQYNLTIDKLCFSYAPTLPFILKDINFTLKKSDKIGIIGTTGSGKSTFLDIFMGLMPASSGSLSSDGIEINNRNVQAWQQNISHVSQNIFIANKSIAENIALNTSQNTLDMELIRYAAKIAQADNFIEATPQGYETILGEQGVTLSGGQCQRIGIARAIYKKRPILVLDEATSALDSKTEKKVIQSLYKHCKDTTLVIVSHRPSLLKYCDRIYAIKDQSLRPINLSNIEQHNSSEA